MSRCFLDLDWTAGRERIITRSSSSTVFSLIQGRIAHSLVAEADNLHSFAYIIAVLSVSDPRTKSITRLASTTPVGSTVTLCRPSPLAAIVVARPDVLLKLGEWTLIVCFRLA